ncbi:MAG: alanine dehydrogenase [Gemmatimonadetes bacterium]|uniref:Alanine dehydrogenase n=1 Tax=Candidatus Kutchimonas denitrificans TaxID=3056748 RepID=A0AAE4ZBX6_9BACT|nr:alanine dehydrogenase [Gemmatimonadota bacterium]NIR76206.1 alanine dehydrogenase [Candidatus Kutchimonas denitrificans]NIS00646.1 alanine dehydrogenase [Gemmatimonadota bacterium]NIT66791.1 alanine dehydrogenase [Gemmatimonadota bacterium]NIV23390.1 alanine dehydrogenase [Gemmatimonadota bacterium]
MIVGVPQEIKPGENRIAMVPAGAEQLVAHGHTLLIEKGAGLGSGFDDAAFEGVGAKIVDDVDALWAEAEMIVKVKEPIAVEYPRIKPDHVLFTYFHFAASETLTKALLESGAVSIAYETVQLPNGELPLLTPMSEVAGRMAVQEGAKYLERTYGGRGILLGGVPGVPSAEVVVLGGGVVGTQAAKMAAGLGARVTILDVSLPRLRYLDDVMPANVVTAYSNRHNVLDMIQHADLLVGAVLLPGAKAPHLVLEEDLKLMRDGAVIVDVAVDQGGCVETVRPTTHEDPTFVVEGVIHYCVANMPGAVPRTSTLALTNATIPYALKLADNGWKEACRADRPLALGVNMVDNKVTCEGVAEAFGLDYTPIERIL